jgi:endonuclease/exonuclease/phosphatase family metal-dependent hydrolase
LLRLVTYNIHKGIGGLDRRYRLERTVDVLSACRGDVVFLQEVDEGVPRSRSHRQVDRLGDALGYAHRFYFPNVFLRRGQYGNAVLSRFACDHQENIDLTLPLKKRRGALHVRLRLPLGAESMPVWLFNVHLGLAQYERRQQLQHLLAWQERHGAPQPAATVLAGDFNDVWGTLGRRVLEPAGFRGTSTRILTFPAARPLRPLDRVFVRGGLRISTARAGGVRFARTASDHLPLVTELVP